MATHAWPGCYDDPCCRAIQGYGENVRAKSEGIALFKSLKFSKPKGPGFGISRSYYLSVLSTKPVMPTLWQLINPQGEGGAITGLGAPLMAGSTKESLQQPMSRGAYALATKDRKTVVKLLVLSKEEANFDPEAIVTSSMASALDPEILARLRATWTIAQATFESFDPNVYPGIHFHLDIVRRMADLTDGVVADPISKRYLLPQHVLRVGTSETTTNVLDVVTPANAQRPDGMHSFTLGLQKLALPELEITGLDPSVSKLAGEFLLSVAQGELEGRIITSGTRLGAASAMFEARQGGHDRALWDGIDVLELLPPMRMTATDALEIWAKERQ
jgi:hypothetical protein